MYIRNEIQQEKKIETLVYDEHLVWAVALGHARLCAAHFYLARRHSRTISISIFC